jgi:hypothetical protein
MGNPHRGEVAVTLGGVDYAARPDYTAIVAWEERSGRITADLALRFGAGVFAMKELVAVIHAALVSGGAKLPVEEVGRLVVEEGALDLLKPAAILLRNALTGGKEPRPGEPKPGELQAAETGASPSAA